jgi:probable F420-dependent oxidoreductase
MKFGYSLFGVGPRNYAEIAGLVEGAGFESLWVSEHLVLPSIIPATYPYSPDGLPIINPDTALFDPWIALSFIAASTTTLRLATNVFILPLRHPLNVARDLVTLDRVSGGRVTLGIGVGWLEEEFVAAGMSFHDRGRRADEMIEIVRRLWTDAGDIEHHGAHYDIGPVRFQPKPIQKPIPIEVGGTSAAALRRAGQLGDGWIELASSDLADLKAMLSVINQHRRDAGRDHLAFEVTVTAMHATLDDVRRLQDAGATRVIMGPLAPRVTVEVVNEFVTHVNDEIISRL